MRILLFIVVLFMLSACNSSKNVNTTVSTKEHNKLTKQEKAEGWKLLFDGKTTEGWRKFKTERIGKSWVVEDGALTFDPAMKDGGDIITTQTFGDFELRLEWKIAPCGNSGIMYFVQESDEYRSVWHTGPEMQVLDNTCHPDAKINKHRAGDLYDLIACSQETVKPAGEWNAVRIVVKDNMLQHWLNEVRVVETQLWDDAWYAMIAKSKFKDLSNFGRSKSGHIALQDHGDKVAFRNIKIKEL